jgi:hypothetical protein
MRLLVETGTLSVENENEKNPITKKTNAAVKQCCY